MTTVLVVEDDAALRRALVTSLFASDYDVIDVATGEEALVHARDRGPDLVLLDLALPGIDGLDTLRGLRSFTDVPVVVLTVRDDRQDKISALDGGADDYVTKPFDSEELLARVRAALRRSPDHVEVPRLQVGDLDIDLERRQVLIGREPVHLTPTELRILETLVASEGRLVPHTELQRRLRGGDANSVRVFVGNLRRKLGDDAASPRLIVNEPGLGYRWIGEPRGP